MHKKAASLTLAVVGLTPLLLLGPAPQASAASCPGTGCNGEIAANTTCVNDAYVAEEKTMYQGSTAVGIIELEYSPSCRSAWARVVSNLSYGSQAEVQNNSYYEECAGSEVAGTGCNTRMVDDISPLASVAAGWVYNGSSQGAYYEVTAAY